MSLSNKPRPLDDDIVLADDPGPFRPPSGYRFGSQAETAPSPRPRPDLLKQGRYASKQRATNWAMLVVGAILSALGPTPVVQTMGLYFLPLAYLTYIGLVVLAFGGLGLVLNAVRSGPYRYVEEGVPVVARILALRLVPSAYHEGNPTRYRFDALFDYLDPETGKPTTAEGPSSDFLADARQGLTTSYRVGDYASAVYLPHDPAKSIKLYGFLDLRPDLGFVRRDAMPEASPAKAIVAVFAVVGIFAAIIWNLYAFGRFSPVQISPTDGRRYVGRDRGDRPGRGRALVARGPSRSKARRTLRGDLRRRRGRGPGRGDRARHPPQARAVRRPRAVRDPHPRRRLAPHGRPDLLLLGHHRQRPARRLARHDEAPADRRGGPGHPPGPLFRRCKLKYHFLDDPKTKRYLSSPAHLDTLDGPLALAEVHAGLFGWPWVKDIRPARIAARRA